MSKAIVVARYEFKRWVGSLRFWGMIGFLVFLTISQLTEMVPTRLPGIDDMFHLIMEMMGGVGVFVPILLVYDVLTKEAELNTLQAILTKPVSRTSLFLGKWLFTVVYAITVITIPLTIGAIWTGTHISKLIPGLCYCTLAAMTFLSWTLAASGLALKKGTGTVAVLSIAAIIFFFTLGMSSDPALVRFSPLRLASLYGMTFEGIPLQAGDIYFGVLYEVCLMILFLSIGIFSFNRQDV